MSDREIQTFLADLKSPSETVRQQATQALWQRWFQQKGVMGLERLQQAQRLWEADQEAEAEAMLGQIIQDLPDFAEAWNRRAVLYYLQNRYPEAIADCYAVLKLNPVHFGAWHGLGLSYAAMGDYRNAIIAFRQALEIQPYALDNQRLILECTARLS